MQHDIHTCKSLLLVFLVEGHYYLACTGVVLSLVHPKIHTTHEVNTLSGHAWDKWFPLRIPEVVFILFSGHRKLQWTDHRGLKLQWTDHRGLKLQWTDHSGLKLQWTDHRGLPIYYLQTFQAAK